MPLCAGPRHNPTIVHKEKNAFRIEPNTGERDENPVLFCKNGNAEECRGNVEGVSIVAIAAIAALVVAVVYLVR